MHQDRDEWSSTFRRLWRGTPWWFWWYWNYSSSWTSFISFTTPSLMMKHSSSCEKFLSSCTLFLSPNVYISLPLWYTLFYINWKRTVSCLFLVNKWRSQLKNFKLFSCEFTYLSSCKFFFNFIFLVEGFTYN